MIKNKAVSSWLRQARHKARRAGIYADGVSIDDVNHIISAYDNTCAYCGSSAETLMYLFPINDNIPSQHSQANIIPVCKKCKHKARKLDVTQMFIMGMIDKERYVRILKTAVEMNGGDGIKECIKISTGRIDE